MRFTIFVSVMAIISGPALASGLSFADAKAKADQVEDNLNSDEVGRLVKAQGQLANIAFPYCFDRTGMRPPNFTVVVEMGADGQVARSWVDKETAFGSCFRERMVKDFRYKPQSRPFFTSFEYKNAS